MGSMFEAIMLICFGLAWPASVYRSYKCRTSTGKSVVFLLVIEAGYVAGIMHKISNGSDAVIYLYVLNAVLVLISYPAVSSTASSKPAAIHPSAPLPESEKHVVKSNTPLNEREGPI